MSAGIVIGATLIAPAISFANTSISAWLTNDIAIFFNGHQKTLPEGYEILVYNGRTYTPARFVAEELGAEVVWDEASRNIFISYDKKPKEEVVDEKPIQEVVEEENQEKEEKQEKQEEEKQPQKNYRKLPLSKSFHEAYVEVTVVHIDTNETVVYVEMEGRRENIPVQLNQMASKLEFGDTVYRPQDLKRSVNPIDTRWYHDVREDDKITGWVKFPKIPEDTKNLTLYLEFFRNDGTSEATGMEFDIAL